VTGGKGRLTVTVSRGDAETLLDAASADRIVVKSRGVRREFELVSLLRRSGRRFRRLTVRDGGVVAGRTLGEESVRDNYDVAVLAVRHGGRWQVAPRGTQAVSAGDELVVVGTREALARFGEAA
jgi:K+/H+ antiporter YhaU regulatory subunit KhtT